MRAVDVIAVHEAVEPGLLLQEITACGPGGLFFEGQVHSIMAAVLLRPAGLDALDADS